MRTWKVGMRKGWGAVWEVTERGEWRVSEAGLAAEQHVCGWQRCVFLSKDSAQGLWHLWCHTAWCGWKPDYSLVEELSRGSGVELSPEW